jgi:hypothetical protein
MLCSILQMLLETPWPNSTSLSAPSPDQPYQDPHTAACAAAAVSCFLTLLQQLLSTYPAALRLCAAAVAQTEELGALLCAGLSCPLEAVVVPLLQ